MTPVIPRVTAPAFPGASVDMRDAVFSPVASARALGEFTEPGASGPDLSLPDLSWIDEFWTRAGPYIFSREEDGVLILPPNRVYKINNSGASLVQSLKKGNKITSLLHGALPEQILSVELFFKTLSDLYSGRTSGALERVPYTFDFTRLPILGEIAVTYRCNNRCIFCYAGCGTEADSDTNANSVTNESNGDLSTDEWKKIIQIFRDEAKIPFFSFTGGEPLVRTDLEELIFFAVDLGLEVNLVSNGTLATEKRAVSLYKAGLKTAQISIEAPGAELHDYLAGRTGSFEETVSGIKALMNAGVSVQTNTTITRANREVAAALPAFIAALGIKRFAMNMYIPGVLPAVKELIIPYDEIGIVVEQVRKAAFNAGLTFFWYSPTPFCYYNPIARGMGNKSCAAVDGLISVSANGGLLPCSSWDEPIGNLLKSSFNDLWFSQRALFYKHKHFAPSVCRECDSFTACQGACPLYWRSYGEGLLEKCNMEKRNKNGN